MLRSTCQKPGQLAAQANTQVRFVTQDNLWYPGPPSDGNYAIDGKSIMPFEPLLGRSGSADFSAKMQELQWLLRYTGRDGSGLIISQEWIMPGDLIDRNLKGTALPLLEKYGDNTLWNIFYDPILAVFFRKLGNLGKPVDFNIDAIYNMWVSDIDYLQKTYFSHKSYWKIRNKPVLYIWNVPALINANRAFDYARSKGIYVLGDAQRKNVSDSGWVSRLPKMEGVTGFVAPDFGLGNPPVYIGDFTTKIRDIIRAWKSQSTQRGFDYIPGGSFQFDNTEHAAAIGSTPLRVIARNADEAKQVLALTYTEAPTVVDTKYIFWGTMNCWPEATTVLPTELPSSQDDAFDRNGRAGNYGFKHLEIVREVMFSSVSAYNGCVMNVGTPVQGTTATNFRLSVQFVDCDVRGTLEVTPSQGVTIKNPVKFPFADGNFVPLVHEGQFKFKWDAELEVASGSELALILKFTSLDKKVTTADIHGTSVVIDPIASPLSEPTPTQSSDGGTQIIDGPSSDCP